MRTRILLVTLALTALAFGQTTTPLLDTGLPNLASPPPPLIVGASSTDPLLNAFPAGTALPPASGPCPTPSSSQPPCVLTAQHNNARQDGNLLETVFTTSNVASSFGATKAQFLVDASALPTY